MSSLTVTQPFGCHIQYPNSPEEKKVPKSRNLKLQANIPYLDRDGGEAVGLQEARHLTVDQGPLGPRVGYKTSPRLVLARPRLLPYLNSDLEEWNVE